MTRVTYFQNAFKIRRFVYPNFFFVETVDGKFLFLRRIVLKGKVVYQSDFLTREFRQNSAVATTVKMYKLKNSVKNSSFCST